MNTLPADLLGRCEILRTHLRDAPYSLLYTSIGLFTGRPRLEGCLTHENPCVVLMEAKLMTWPNLENTNDVGQVTLFVSELIGFTTAQTPLPSKENP